MTPPPPNAAPVRPPVIGIVGGVASGKSTVARLFGELGCVVIDADEIARAISERPEIRAEVGRRFGPQFLDGEGRLDRRRLADRVFADPAARAELESILHPPVHVEIEAALVRAQQAGRPVVLDVPLLLESGLQRQCDAIVFVAAPEASRVARASERGWTEEEFRRRERAQTNLSVKQHAAGHILHAHTIEDTRLQVRDIYSRLTP